MTTLHPIEMTGLRGHHPLAFLAACGLLRIVSQTNRAWLAWNTNYVSEYWTAVLYIEATDAETDAVRNELVAAVAESAEKFREDLEQVGITEGEALVSDFRKWSESVLTTADPLSPAFGFIGLLPAVGSELLQRRKESGKNKGKFVIGMTGLAMTSGQQDLISGARKAADKLVKRSRDKKIPSSVRQKIEEALFGPWSYQDDEHSLGWDPNSQRLHALRSKAPTKDDKNRSVVGAVFLATQALPLFPCFAIGRKLYTTGFHHDDGGDWFSWPIWRDPISLDTLQSLLAHPFTADLQRRGVELVYRCRRVRTGGAEGNYQVFSHSQGRPWPRA